MVPPAIESIICRRHTWRTTVAKHFHGDELHAPAVDDRSHDHGPDKRESRHVHQNAVGEPEKPVACENGNGIGESSSQRHTPFACILDCFQWISLFQWILFVRFLPWFQVMNTSACKGNENHRKQRTDVINIYCPVRQTDAYPVLLLIIRLFTQRRNLYTLREKSNCREFFSPSRKGRKGEA